MAFRCENIELDLGDSQFDSDLVECWELMLGELESGELQLPIMSGNAHRISTYARDSNSDQDELVELIMGDQSVSGHLLRISNSTAYSRGEPVLSVSDAVQRLGFKFVSLASLSISLKNEHLRIEGLQDQTKLIVQHAHATAIYASEVASLCGAPADQFYLCGLLHTIGKPVGLKLLKDVCRRHGLNVSAQNLLKLCEMEYPKFGARLLQEWHLPDLIVQTCRWARNPNEAPFGFQRDADIVHVASRYAKAACCDTFNACLAGCPASERLGVGEGGVEHLISMQNEVSATVSRAQ
jgi:HD-like signal output (HDOD) protein